MTPNITLFISIVTYLLMGGVMYSLGLQSYNLSNRVLNSHAQRPYFNKYFFFSILFFALMCGLRYRCGADCESYASGYDNLLAGRPITSYKDREELFFEWIARFLAWLGVGRVIYLGVWAFLEIFFFYNALKTRNFLLPYIGLLLIMGPHFCSWNNGIRQTIASCIFVLATVGLIDGKKLWHYFAWIAVAFFFHKSSLLLVPLVLMKLYNRKPRMYIALAALFVSVYIGQTGLLDAAFGRAESVLMLLDYEEYAENFELTLAADATVTSYGPRRIVLLASFILIVLFSEKMDSFFKQDKFYRLSFLFFMVYACTNELLIGKTSLLTRPFLYFMPFFLISSGYLLCYLKRMNKNAWYVISLVVLCAFSMLNSLAEFRVPDEVGLYKFIFLK